MKTISKNVLLVLLFLCFFAEVLHAQTRTFYQEPTWTPRALLPYDDAINDTFWPKSPAVNNSYNDPGFAEERLSKLPAPGVHPRVLMTPDDIKSIQAKIALGDKAPKPFQVMWQRQSKIHNAFYALVTNDDSLGQELATDLVRKMKLLEPKLDLIDKQADRENLWYLERSIMASGEPDPAVELWSLLDYDYLHKWMTADERELARKLIARITAKRISNFMAYPDHFMINNHQGFGMEYIRLMLLIEGEKGFNQELFNLAAHKANAMLDWFLDDDGMCYETIKGWLNTSAFVAVGLLQRNLLKHDHLRAKMRFFQAALRWEDGTWKIRDEMRASAFHPIWMMHYYHPNDQGIDLLYQSTFSTHEILTNPDVRWPDPVGISPELLLLYADNGITDKKGNRIDWENQANINSLNLPLTWKDDQRGYVETRNSWRKDDLHLGFACKQDFFYGGHEGSENNRIILWKDGVNWIKDNNMLAAKATFLQNMLTVDGKGQHWPPVAGTWLGFKESQQGLMASGDGKDGYSFTKSMQVHPLNFPSAKLGYYAPFTEGNFDLSRDLQIAYNPRTIKFNDGYAHTDYGPWSGETRLVESYRPWNPMLQAYRTVHMARGENPYVLLVDDANKDGQAHSYECNFSVPLDVDLVDVLTPEIVFQNTEPSAIRTGDIILGKSTSNRSNRNVKTKFEKGEPLCLIRILWRNTDFGFPTPRFEKLEGYNQVTIPAHAVSPEFRVLIYPFKYGEPIPKTSWNKERTELTVQLKNQTDVYHFGQTDGGRTVLQMERDGKQVLASEAKPARPVLLVRGATFDINDLRYTRDESKVPTYLIDGTSTIQLVRPVAPAVIRYTLDGSEPTDASALYEGPVEVNKTCDLKAAVYNPTWVFGTTRSETTTAHLVVKEAVKGLTDAPANSKNGLIATVYEKNTKLYNDKGFFEASRMMLPDLSKETPTLSTAVNGFTLPQVTPKKPLVEQCKGFYRYSGLFYAKERGVYKFDVNSCGPVTFDVGNQAVIESIGVFHQQQAHRTGEAVLDKGWHNLELIICDPLFWNINSLEAMPLEVSYRINGGLDEIVSTQDLRYLVEQKSVLEQQAEINWHDAINLKVKLEPGFDLQLFDQTGKRRDADFLDIDGMQPLRSIRTKELESTDSRNIVRAYSGYFYAPISGIYSLSTIARTGDNGVLGSKQASCQNQVRVDGEVVVQRGVFGRNPSGRVGLKKGWHAVSMRFGPSETTCKVLFPDGQTVLLTGDNVFCHTFVSFSLNGSKINQNPLEIYEATKIEMSMSGTGKTEIRYTLDGTLPNSSSALYKALLNLQKSTKLTAMVFDGGTVLTAPAELDVKMVEVPKIGSLGKVNFDKWRGACGNYAVDGDFQLWLAPSCQPAVGMHGKALGIQTVLSKPAVAIDVNVSRGSSNAGLKLHHLKMRDNALTVALWIKPTEQSGKLFGKDGYNAFGKGYRTLSCTLNNGKVVANPGRLSGGMVDVETWQFIVLTADENEMGLYLNGSKIASGAGTKDITTDALDFFVDNNLTLDGLQLFDRLLQPEEVKRLYDFGKKGK